MYFFLQYKLSFYLEDSDIGLTMAELEEIAKLGHKALKTSQRDIAYVVAIGGNGATTVSATMFFFAAKGWNSCLCYWRYWRSSSTWRDFNGYFL